jgi:hypothetical protein
MLCFDLCVFSAVTACNKFCMCIFSNHWYTQSYLKQLQVRVTSFCYVWLHDDRFVT